MVSCKRQGLWGWLCPCGSRLTLHWACHPASGSTAILHPCPLAPCSPVSPWLTSPTGDLLIIMAQIIVSIQMVLEEKFVYRHNVHPLRAVGTEGM